ncbi:MAG TPA: (5-formylfuran-3-yl)methyl phosphate synthase [Methylocella sp.]|nr:(5-formylfuran-3-yl)methyl phosphate synthase [Methylocella sp.]
MTLMLASVASQAEAEIVWAGGADIIDLKDPAKGAFGALDPGAAAEIVRLVGKRKPVSAAAGTALGAPGKVLDAIGAMAAAGVDYVKIAFSRDSAGADCVRALGQHTKGAKLVGILLADREPDFGILALMAEHGFSGAMLDTSHKGAGRLIDHLGIAALDEFVSRCREFGLMSGLAGSLEAPDVPRLLPLRPDYLGFRGSLCHKKDREEAIDPAAVRLIRDLIPPGAGSLGGLSQPGVDWRLALGRGYSSAGENAAETDRVFVHDLVLPCEIGAYDFERGRLQDVRFNIDVDVRRCSGRHDDMRGVFSYDLIIDAIKIILGKGHIDLIETLASRIADDVLRHPGVVRVWVRVEKLDVVRGTVGIEIKRERAAALAAAGERVPAVPGNAARRLS